LVYCIETNLAALLKTVFFFSSQVFNLGDYRRNVEDHYHDHSYFDPNNEKAAQMREQVS
jgi:hypothetical protein